MSDDFLRPTVVEAIAAAAEGPRGMRLIVQDDDERFTSYADLTHTALALLARWTVAGVRAGDEVVLFTEAPHEFVAALWACFFGRLIAVPLTYGTSPEHLRKLANVLARLERPWIATTSTKAGSDRLLDPSIPEADAPLAELPSPIDPSSIALVQFSSGSTGMPKGVTVTHAALVRNAADMALHGRFRSTDRLLSWMPLTHDMGLVGFHVAGVIANLDQILMPTSLFVRRPVLWMKKCAEHRASVLYSPNFGYHYFLSAFRAHHAAGWDLGCVRMIFNGAEPISAALCRRFSETLAPYGFDANAIVPGYGLAEATLLVSLGTPGEPMRTMHVDRDTLARGEVLECDGASLSEGIELVMAGTSPAGTEVRITGDDGAELPERRVGHIEMRGPTVTRRYYRDPDATAAALRGDGWLDTGDLGFLAGGQLVPTGRAKDLIFVNGANYYPHDLERVSGIEPGEVAAAGVPRPDGLREDIVVFVRHKGSPETFEPIAASVRRRIAAETGLVVDRVIPVSKLPKTTSGKIQRHRLVSEYGSAAAASNAAPAKPLLETLTTIATEILGRDAEPDTALAEQGMSSMQAAQLARRASELANRELPVSVVFDYPTLRALANHIEGDAGRSPVTRRDAGAPEPMAIIGAGLRFPGGIVDLATFARALENRVDAVREVPLERWDVTRHREARWGAFLDDVDRFDHRFFSVSPVEAQAVDPQQRLLLETTWEAFESAGVVPADLAGTATGVFIGISNNDYASKHLRSFDPRRIDGYALTGSALSTAAGRISYVFGFQGPCLAVDTACSSSLVAVHLAARSLAAGECTVALAGGVNLILGPEVHIGFARLGAMAADGRCKVFDESADGYVRGEGCAVIVMKRLRDAEAAGDPILAVLHGSAINQDGASNGLTAPNGLAQEQVIRTALDAAGLQPADVGYVEAHGTGTPLGDPQELHALAAVYGDRSSRLLVGSVKSNLGHLESAAGIAGLLKAVIAVRDGWIPANLHHSRPTPHFRWDTLAVPTEPVAWTADRRIAAVSSFGFSGTNAHALIGSAGVPRAGDASSSPPYVLTISAKSREALDATRAEWIEFLAADEQPLEAVVATAAHRRTHHPYRLAVAAGTREDLVRELEAAPIPSSATRRDAVFIFPGQGGQWNGMGRQLFAHDALFRQTIEECDAAFRAYVDWSLADAIRDGFDCAAGIDRVQPALFAFGVALARMWRARGVEPAAVVGHSMGEVAAAHIAGVLSLDDAARIICRRSRIIRRAAGRGVMCSVELSAADARMAIRGLEERVSIAAINSRESTVLSGDEEALETLMRDLGTRGVFCRRIQVDVASHSPQMDPLRAELLEALQDLAPHAPAIPMESTVLGRAIDGDRLDAGYWVRNLREPVSFAPAIERLLARGERLFVEMSPHPVLVAAVEQEIARAGAVDAHASGSLRRNEPELLAFARSIAGSASIATLRWDALVPRSRRVATLPRYTWQRERFWLDDPAPAAAGPHPFLDSIIERAADGARVAEGLVDVATVPWLADHRVGEAVVFPAAAWIDAVLAVAPESNALRNVELLEPLELPAKLRIQIEVARDGRFRAYSRPRDGNAPWRLHVRGTVGSGTVVNHCEEIASREIRDFYASLDYGPAFQLATRITRTSARIPAADPSRDARHVVDPPRLDAVFHPLLSSRGIIPVAIDELIVDRAALAGELDVHVVGGAIIVPGALVARGVRLRAIETPALRHELVWRPATREPAIAGRTITWEAPAGEDAVALTAALVHFLQSVVRAQWTDMPRVRVITRGAHAVDPGDPCDPVHAALSAVVRTFAAEHPEFSPCAVDLPLHPGEEDRLLVDAAHEPQVAIRGGRALVPRLVPRAERPIATAPRAATDARFRAVIAQPGRLDRIALRELPEPQPRAGQVVVEVHAAGLNFLNVLSALGLYPGYPNGFRTLGMELSGVITAVGADVTELAIGDEVVGIAEDALGSHVVARAELLCRKPASISFDQAAALPIAYATAIRSLRHLAQLRAGERVLIHSAAGGVGLAAIAVARAAGAEIFATAGTEEKRALLRSMGIANVFDSRSLDFAGAIGPVDVVLSALTGDAREASLALLAPGGRFIELGKRWQDDARGTVTAANGAFFFVDLDQLANDRPAALRELLETAMREVADRTLPALPLQTFSIDQTAEAFHRLAGGTSAGKLVVRPREGEAHIEPVLVRRDGTYLITGGTGAIGSAVAARLAERGAQSILAIGRAFGDIADERTFMDVLTVIQSEGRPPLRGIIHCAGVLDDAPLLQLSDEQIARVFAPKAAARHLDAPALDFFVCVSSAAALFAPAGQAGYAAASAYVDALMHERRRRGQRATAIDLGPVGDVGLAASRTGAAQVDALRRMRALRIEEAVDLIEEAIVSPFARVIGIDIHGVTGDPLIGFETRARNDAASEIVRISDPDERLRAVEAHLVAQTAAVLRARPCDIDRDVTFKQLGIDSLMALQLKNRLRESLGITVPVTTFWAHPTVAELSESILDQLAPRPVERPVSFIESLTDEEAERLLLEKVR